MKKLISLFVFTVLLAGLVVPAISLAQQGPKECCTLGSEITVGGKKCEAGKVAAPTALAAADCSGAYCTDSAAGWGMYCLLNTIHNVTNWIFYILLVAVVLLVVIGGAMYMMSAGDAEKAGKGKSIIIYGIIGLALALVAKLIPSVVRLIMGMS